jgi:hypothetical protein
MASNIVPFPARAANDNAPDFPPSSPAVRLIIHREVVIFAPIRNLRAA